MNEVPALKIKMLRSSNRCLVFGLLAFLPVIGLPFAFAALWISGRVRRLEKDLWNAAKPCRLIGATCAAFATVMWLLVAGIIALNIVSQINN